MRSSGILIAIGAAFIASGIAFAQPGKGPVKGKGGAMLETHFAEMDANGDGNVDHDEFIEFQMKKNEQRWAMFSSHAGEDGVVSLEEAKAHHAQMKEMHGAGRGKVNCQGEAGEGDK